MDNENFLEISIEDATSCYKILEDICKEYNLKYEVEYDLGDILSYRLDILPPGKEEFYEKVYTITFPNADTTTQFIQFLMWKYIDTVSFLERMLKESEE